MSFFPPSAKSILYVGSNTVVARQTWAWDGATWMRLLGPQPESGHSHAMVYDSKEQAVIVFGGNGPVVPVNYTTKFDASGWLELNPPGPRPMGRRSHAMAYDSRREVTVLFGGSDGNGTYFGDTWEFDGQAWRQVATTGPSPRYRFSMAYDAQRGVTVLFGGNPTLLRDTWEWDGVTWTQRTTGGPPGGGANKMTYHEGNGLSILTSYSETNQALETWSWDGVAWRVIDENGPSARSDHAMTYDSTRQRIVLFGGRDVNGFPLGDTWEYGLYPDCDQTTGAGELDIFDFLCFMNKFVAQEPYACDCDTATGQGVCDVFDFMCFQDLFAGCP